MSTWIQTYQFKHFIPFGEETYFRIFEKLNESCWPIPLLFLLAVLLISLYPYFSQKRGKLLVGVNALSWISVAYFFFFSSLSQLLPFSGVFFVLFLLSGMVVFTCGLWQKTFPSQALPFIALCSLLGVPVVEGFLGGEVNRLSLIGLAPLPSIVWTLGLGVLFKSWRRVVVVAISCGWGILFLFLRLSLR